MAKKRKASSRQAGGRRAEGSGGRDGEGNQRFKMKVGSYMDVADSQDEWDLERDKILLDDDGYGGPKRKRQRHRLGDVDEDEMDESGESVLNLPSESDSEDDDDDYGDDERQEGAGDPDEDGEEDYDEDEEGEEDGSFGVQASRLKDKKSKARGLEEDKEEEEDDDGRKRARPEDEEGWGYEDAYGADVAENEEDAKEIEAEAIRLQKKRLEGLTDADFGIDETEWLGGEGLDGGKGAGKSSQGADGAAVEVLPIADITEDTPAEERQRILKLRYPEFEPLAGEYIGLRAKAVDLADKAREAEATLERQRRRGALKMHLDADLDETQPTSVLKYNALSSYLAVLAMYFALLTSTAELENGVDRAFPLDPKELREHPVMETLVRQRTLWEEIKDLSESEYEDAGEDREVTPEPAEASEMSVYYTPQEQSFPEIPPIQTKVPKRKRLTKAEKAALKAQEAEKAEHEARLRELDEDMARIAKMTEAIGESNGSTTQPKQQRRGPAIINDNDSDFGDETELSVQQAQEKDRRKKSLRFYTSQIAQKDNKRSAASRNAGGDTDIPYKERLKDRQARLNAEAEARGKRKRGGDPDDELGGESDEEDRADAAAIRGDDDDDDEEGELYYQTIASGKAKKKADKEARKVALKEAALRPNGVGEDAADVIGPDGKRAIGYTIEKNKGLTQNRRKDVRNPRVKKRRRFEDKKKKLASMRPVYKGGEGRGGYGGELTGIKKSLVRAVKL